MPGGLGLGLGGLGWAGLGCVWTQCWIDGIRRWTVDCGLAPDWDLSMWWAVDSSAVDWW